MKNPFILAAALISGLICSAQTMNAAHNQLLVSGGDFDRENTILTFPAREIGDSTALEDAQGKRIPVQFAPDGTAVLIIPYLEKQRETSFRIVSTQKTHSSKESVQVIKEGNKLKVTSGGKSMLEYQAEPGDLPRPDIKASFLRGGYIHPVMSPSGRIITDDYPRNHIHHHGIWAPWTKTKFEGREPDFWNMGDGKGKVDFLRLESFWSGPVHGGFKAQHQFVDLTGANPRAALNETWQLIAYHMPENGKARWVFDLISTQECASTNPLILPKYHYGGLGFRGNWDWNGKDKTFFLTSEGETNRVDGNETRGRWCHIGGVVDGQYTGLAILCHPSNFRAPQPMRLHPTEPFFCFAPSQLGDWEITPGKPYVSRYRFIVQDGRPDKEELDNLWKDYANPPRAEFRQL